MQNNTIIRYPAKQTRNVLGIILTAVGAASVVVLLIQFPRFLSKIITGVFGLYSYAIFGLFLFFGITLLNQKKYVIRKQYIARASLAVFSFLAFIHLLYTASLFGGTFAKFLSNSFSQSTPGGVIFSIVLFPIASIFTIIGTYIILAILFIFGVFLVVDYFLAGKQYKQVLDRKMPEVPNLVKATLVPKEQKAVSQMQEYYDNLEKDSRSKLDLAKSKLGLVRPQNLPPEQPAQYNRPISMGQTQSHAALFQPQPQGMGGLVVDGDSLNALTNAAAQNFINDLNNANQRPIINTEEMSPQIAEGRPFPQPEPFVMPSQPQIMRNMPKQEPSNFVAQKPQTEDDFEEFLTDKEVEKIEPVKPAQKPIVRVRTTPSVTINGQMSMDDVAAVSSRSKKIKKSARYVRPAIDLIKTESTHPSEYCVDVEGQATALAQTLSDFRIDCEVVSVVQAPAVTRYELKVPANVNVNKIAQYSSNIKMNLACDKEIRIEAPIPGKPYVGVEVPNRKVGIVSIKELLLSREFINHKSPLAFALGKNINGDIIIADLLESLHTLIAGATGSGKSVCLNTMLTSILFRASPDEVKLLLVDPKMVELNAYNGLPHMIVPNAISNSAQAVHALKWLEGEMMYRYSVLQENHFNNINLYHQLPEYKAGKIERMPFIVCVLDEIGDLLATGKKDVEEILRRLVALARATGIILVAATQKPTADVITTTIKSNFPSRIAFAVANGVDSRTILDEMGAECLRGRGDMLFKDRGTNPVRIQGCYIDRYEQLAVLQYIKENNEADFDSSIENFVANGPSSVLGGGGAGKDMSFENDPLFVQALNQAVYSGFVSASGIQRRFSLGFNRASRLVDTMEELGYVEPKQGNSSKPRKMLLTPEEFESKYGNN